ncbi:winged helix-turn-helix transcriptional regulator [Candidatus Thorarchaeota archaeon]|nr:MAG: winged helix-turn-helix transcriptional regulator [Candidatus Thorarchaeota archaeon]
MEELTTKIGVVSGPESGMIEDSRGVIDILKDSEVDFVVEEKLAESLKMKGIPVKKMDVDVLAIIGSDRFLLRALLDLGHTKIPILPIASMGQPDFLFDVLVNNFESVIEDLIASRWSKEEKTRLVAEISGRETPPLLNDIGIFAKRSATLIRYSLLIDDEHFWKDGSDGLIIATPTGSTAYSLSIGGPVILNSAKVFSIIPVNSVNPSRRPLVLSDDIEILIQDLTSSVAIEAVLDGQIRRKIDSKPVIIRKAIHNAIFVKFDVERVAELRGKLLKKTETSEDLAQELPPSAKLVLKVLEYQGQLSQKEIIEETKLPPRTVRYAISLLMSEGLVIKKLSLRDSRQGIYQVKKAA